MSTFRPKLAEVSSQWHTRDGRPVLVLQNALGLSDSAIALPPELALLPALCDGSRDVGALRAALLLRAGVRISEELLSQILQEMDEALLFEGERLAQARSEALRRYQAADGRPPASAGSAYPSDAGSAALMLGQLLEECARQTEPPALPAPAEALRGILSPHIDYYRGGPVYAGTWRLAAPALCQADLVVILGTDHRGGDGTLTLTRQSYRTPWGILPTDRPALERLAARLGAETALANELHHAVEHSVELAAVWLHYMALQTAGGAKAPFSILPILCGSLDAVIEGRGTLEQYPQVRELVQELRAVASERRVVFVAAADLAHMGPAFGGYPVGFVERAACRAADEALLRAVCAGDAEGFLERIVREGNRRNVCGVTPIYLMLAALGPAQGVTTGYQLCPADEGSTSIVSIAGALLW